MGICRPAKLTVCLQNLPTKCLDHTFVSPFPLQQGNER